MQTKGPEVTLTRQNGDEKVTVTFNVTNTVNASDSGDDSMGQNPSSGNVDEAMAQASSQLKSRPSFTVDITRKAGGHTLSFLCSFLPDDYPDMSSADQKQQADEPTSNFEDFQIDEFAIHQGEWNEKVYSADCSVIDGELYDKLLNILEEHGIGEGKNRTKREKHHVQLVHRPISSDYCSLFSTCIKPTRSSSSFIHFSFRQPTDGFFHSL